jgi:secondary thiamine-phosphate synthase enzyme
MLTTKQVIIQMKGYCDITDITPRVEQQLAEATVSDGIVTVFVVGSTAGVCTIELESGLLADFQHLWERIVPQNIPYSHDSGMAGGNGFSHVRASLMGASLVVPFKGKKLTLGTWQQIVVVDFDNRPRTRQVILQIMGE